MTNVLYYPDQNSEALVARVIRDVDLNTVDLQIQNNFSEVYNIPRKGTRLTQKGKLSKDQYPYFADFLDQALGFNSIQK